MEYRGFTSEGSLDAARLIVNPDSNDTIVVAYASDTPIPVDTTMFEFQFNIIDEATETNHYTVSIDECTMYDCGSAPFVLNTENGSVNNLGLVTVTYEAGEGINAPEQVQVKYGLQITIPDQVPSREGFEFAGWALSADATTVDYRIGDTIDCSSSITLYAVWNTHSHNWDEGVVTTDPTCTQSGVKIYTCDCGHSYTEEIVPTGHSYQAEFVWDGLECTSIFTCVHNDTEVVKIPCFVSTEAEDGSIRITAVAAYNGIAETDTKTVTVIKENNKVIVDLTALNGIDLLVAVVGYEISGRMVECRFLQDEYSAEVTGDVIQVFFLDENYVPVLPKVTLD